MAHHHLGLRPALKWRLFELAARTLLFAPRDIARFAPLLGDMAYLLAPGPRGAVRSNLRQLFPHADARRIRARSRGIFRSVVRYYVDLLSLPARSVAELRASLDVQGYEHVLEARRCGRGVILACTHHGPAELALQAFAARGIPCTAMIERLEPPQLADVLLRIREAHGEHYVYPGLGGTRALVRTLRRGGAIALLIDRDITGAGIEVTFCGGTILAPRGILELARVTGARIVPGLVRWSENGAMEVRFLPPLELSGSSRREQNEREVLEGLLSQFEPHLRRYPDQWLLLHRIWFQRS